jgi:hypothetical protein
VASKRQIAANRRNARKSAGPRSAAGKRRASQNTYRHGLSGNIGRAERAAQVETLARMIAGDTTDAMILDFARTAAEAELDLRRIRQIKVACIEHMLAFGESNDPDPVTEVRDIVRFLKTGILPEPVDALATMPQEEPARSAEAVRRALPQLLKLDRYERRAAARRNRSITIIGRRQ